MFKRNIHHKEILELHEVVTELKVKKSLIVCQYNNYIVQKYEMLEEKKKRYSYLKAEVSS